MVDYIPTEIDVLDAIRENDEYLMKKYKEVLDDIYYNTTESLVSDEIYDTLKDVLIKLDPQIKLKIGSTIRQGDNKAKLPLFLGSCDKITQNEPEALTRWKNDNKADSYIISDKLDGVSCLYYKHKDKVSLYTRGDGDTGSDISHMIPYLNLPDKKRLPPYISVRGEIIIKRSIFEEKYTGDYKNPRNMATGLLSAKTARAGHQDLNFVVYELIEDYVDDPLHNLELLKGFKFVTVSYSIVNKIDMKSLNSFLENRRELSPYDIDGIVICANTSYDRNTSGNPSYMFAFKNTLEKNIHTTKVLEIDWSISKWGKYKPVAIIEPVKTLDITMTRVTAHNAKFVEDNKLGKGSIIRVTRSNDVIPYIVDIVSGSQADFPDDFVWDKNHVNILFTGESKNSCIELLSSFFQKLSIKHVSSATVKKMYDSGLDTLFKILEADKDRLAEIPTFKSKSVDRIYDNIHNTLKNGVELETLIGATGLLGFGMGRKKTKALLLSIPDIFKDCYGKEQLYSMILNVEGFSDLTARKVIKNIKYAKEFLRKMEPYVTYVKRIRVDDSLKDKKIVMSGFRNKDLEEAVTSRGGKITSSISKTTDYLILPDTPPEKESGKVVKARKQGVKIMTFSDFKKLIDK